MPVRSFDQSILYNLNFIPWLTIMTFMLVMVYVLPSDNKQPGYVFVSVLSGFCCFLWLREKRRVAQKVSVDEETIVASGLFMKDTSIAWKDIINLMFSGKGLYFIAWKSQKFLYAEIISKDNKKIVIRRDIHKFEELIKLIEDRAEKTFRAKLNESTHE